MLEKLIDNSFAAIVLVMFFIYAISYNVGYFNALGNSFWYFLYFPLSIVDVIKTGIFMLFWLAIILILFKSILINPAFNSSFPSANILMFIVAMVLITNLLYFVVFADSKNRELLLFLEISFYIFALLCAVVLVYYFLGEISSQILVVVFFLSLMPVSFLIGVADAKISVLSALKETKSQILLTNEKVISANILRSFDKGILIKVGNYGSNLILWDQIKEINFKKVEQF